MHIPKKRRQKLDSKSDKCIFIGYKDGVKGYKLWNPATATVVYIIDVIFREDESCFETKEVTREKEPRKLEFNLRNESHDSDGSIESKEEVEVQTLVVRTFGRTRKQPERYSPIDFSSAFALSSIESDPIIGKEAIYSTNNELQKKAMEEEMESLRKNDTWDLVALHNGRIPIISKWVFKRKTNATGHIKKFKARLVGKRYSQVKGADLDDIFHPITKLTSIRLLFSLVATFDLEIEKMEVRKTFLHGYLEEEIYMKHPEGFTMKGKEELACRFKKSLYGLRLT